MFHLGPDITTFRIPLKLAVGQKFVIYVCGMKMCYLPDGVVAYKCQQQLDALFRTGNVPVWLCCGMTMCYLLDGVVTYQYLQQLDALFRTGNVPVWLCCGMKMCYLLDVVVTYQYLQQLDALFTTGNVPVWLLWYEDVLPTGLCGGSFSTTTRCSLHNRYSVCL